MMIHLLLVDDQENIRQGLRMRLSLEPDMSIIGEAGNGRQAIDLTLSLKPEVVIMDVEMPVMDGITATQHIHDVMEGSTAIVMLSIHSDPEMVKRAYAAGACAFVGKLGELDSLLAAIRYAADQTQHAAH